MNLWGVIIDAKAITDFLTRTSILHHIKIHFATESAREDYENNLTRENICLPKGTLPLLKSYAGPVELRKAISGAWDKPLVPGDIFNKWEKETFWIPSQ